MLKASTDFNKEVAKLLKIGASMVPARSNKYSLLAPAGSGAVFSNIKL